MSTGAGEAGAYGSEMVVCSVAVAPDDPDVQVIAADPEGSVSEGDVAQRPLW